MASVDVAVFAHRTDAEAFATKQQKVTEDGDLLETIQAVVL
jgi:hypothetical protein